MAQGHYERYMNSRRNGYGMNLYRNTQAKKIGGVCAGIADHFEVDHNIMRILFVATWIFTGGVLAIWAYIVAWVVLLPRKDSEEARYREEGGSGFEYDEKERCYRRKKIFRYREDASERLRRAKLRLNKIVARVDNIERYVTSNKFNLHSQFADLEK